MYSKKIFIALVLLISIFQLAVSQNNTNSPYTRFGYGDVTESTPAELRGMGGVSITNYSKNTINPVNPASYSSVDSLTFMFDVATGFRYSRFSDKTGASSNTFNGNLEYITLRLPLGKSWGFSAGLLPYSFSGYAFTQSDSLTMLVYPGEAEKKIGYTQSFIGNGGFYQVYSGLSFRAFNHISLGANVYYMFGDINNYRTLVESNSSSSSTVYNNKIHASDFRLRYGLQLFNTFNKRHTVTLGLIYENKTKLNGSFSETLNDSVLGAVGGSELPQLFGAGLSYNLDDKLTIGMDYKMQSWGNSLFFGHKDSLVNSSSFSLGAEYIPNPRGRKMSERIRYRIGLNTSNPYYKVGTQTLPNNFGLSLGIGIPMRDNFTNKISYINAALEYGKIGSNSMLREDYLKLTISASFNELWFFKRKL
ncbi:putative outer membrane protein [uncultured Paludibacter sp.]|uniref:Putative outer membrane protein n=1 Tax=uncultured Paludibacter sp. TaxID=497635 RepID=A0A653AEQ3_9BACT|nr:putative outer membrane protein [uncultured Paludibacter sp.]